MGKLLIAYVLHYTIQSWFDPFKNVILEICGFFPLLLFVANAGKKWLIFDSW